ncbi:hypothetical protein RXV86_02565 [Alisedimentitalea sp. MJ-SS2]|uniref:hypothetical protein n=1 Tax=Aliisedimentitalea sp. MJ-SS2 TaxID=3049795 RepID=UPI0029121559|nr:hypothetical protein [Alisedimentitalea sp. MJ-SS2]MDU8926258.1 hypothetical protein [Alisedimentitalea sp. MJ-SS2]
MKPNFALSLSFEGISLLHRAFPGWNRVGEVALDSPDLAGALAVLRDTAAQIDSPDFTTKLIVPNDQIKFLSLDLGITTEDERHQAVHDALEGATPYPVDDLAFDWSVDGDRTLVAAVARETLAEAEGFAQTHGFNPVSFVALPDAGQFAGEPFFGAAENATTILPEDEQVQRDMAAIHVTGVARLPDPGDEVDAAENEGAAEEDAVEDAQAAVTKSETDPAHPPETPVEPEAEPTAATETEPECEPEPAIMFGHARDDGEAEAEEIDLPAKAAILSDTLPSEDVDDAAETATSLPATDDTETDETGPLPAFSTMRATRDDDAELAAPALGGIRRGTEDLTAPSIPLPDADEPAAPMIEATPEPYGNLDELDDIDAVPPLPAAFAGDHIEDQPDAFSSEAGYYEEDDNTFEDPTVSDPVAPRETRLAVLGRHSSQAASGLANGVRSSMAARSARRAAERETARDNTRRKTEAERENERQRMTVFGARKPEKQKRAVGGKPRYLGLALSAVLLLFLAGVAAWASIFMDEGLSRFFGAPPETQITTLPDDVIDELLVEGEEAMVPTAPEQQVETASLATPEPDAVPELRPLQPTLPHALTEREAQARYAVTGVWQRAPQAPQLPDQLGLDNLYVTSIDPRVDEQDAVALPASAALTTDFAMARVPLPAARGTRFDLDDRGLVVARAEGALSPEGFMVFTGRPTEIPPAVQARLRQDVDQTQTPAVDAAQQERFAGVRPKPRPEGLVEISERETLGGLTRAELASKRPKARPAHPLAQVEADKPEDKKPEDNTQTADAAKQEAEQEGEQTVETGTRYAVAVSTKPKPRPSNFAKKVEHARKNSDPAETTRVAAAVPSKQVVKPAAPSKTSVAKAATVRNQINLRKINLIGVYGKPSSRRALVRLSNGRYKKVKVGDRLDGGRVSSIRDTELRYTKNGRNVILKMPRG